MTNQNTSFSLKDKRVWVAGHRGMVGSAMVRRLAREGCEVLTVSRDEVDLRRQADVEKWLEVHKPDVIFQAAATIGGIIANDRYPVDFLYDNMMIGANIIHGAYRSGVEKLLIMGSSCIYPKLAEQPIEEDALLTGPLEPTNEWHAVAKISSIKLCEAYRKQYGCDFISAMSTNLYGPGDNYDLTSSHVLPALLRKAHEAKAAGQKTMEIWGSGAPLREFLHADDCADACIFLMQNYSGLQHVNVGSGEEISIEALARLAMKTVGFEGDLTKDITKPDGAPRKLMNSERLRGMGWSPRIPLEEGIKQAYQEFLDVQGD